MHISNIYLAYVKRFFLSDPDAAIQVFAGASFDEQEILEWIDEGKKQTMTFGTRKFRQRMLPILSVRQVRYQFISMGVILTKDGNMISSGQIQQVVEPLSPKRLLELYAPALRQKECYGKTDMQVMITICGEFLAHGKAATFQLRSRKRVMNTLTTDVRLRFERN